jgi:twitching motility protein PilI
MAQHEALRELQARLVERLGAARAEPAAAAAWLAVEAGGAAFLLPLADAGEIFPDAGIVSLPHTQPWFRGVANLRGVLHGVVDLAAFLGLAARGAESARDASRLVALNPALGAMAALRVERLMGLRRVDEMNQDVLPDGSRPAFAKGRWRDAAGRLWEEIDLAALAANERFLAIAA